MSTLAIMKARIADELARADLTSQIAYAITDAIGAYEDKRFHFNEGRSLTFSTVASQEFYDSDDAAGIANVLKIDYVVLYVGDTPFYLSQMTPTEIEAASTNGTSTGQPGWYAWYGSQIRLYPIPAEVWTVRIGCSAKVAAPTSDSETANPWMTHAERLIRSRAKLEIALHVIRNAELAGTMTAAANEALEQLTGRTNQLTQLDNGRVQAMEF